MSNFEKVGVIFVTGLVAVILAMSFFGTGQDQALTSRGTDTSTLARAEREAADPPARAIDPPASRRGSEASRGPARGVEDSNLPRAASEGMTPSGGDPPRESGGRLDFWKSAIEKEPVGSGNPFELRKSSGPESKPASTPPAANSDPNAPVPEIPPRPERSGGEPPAKGEPEAAAPPRTYVVRSGDTLCDIAERELGSELEWKRIAEANPGVKPEKLAVGTKLVIPAPSVKNAPAAAVRGSAVDTPPDAPRQPSTDTRVHQVAAGESLIRIARDELKDAGRWREILALNKDVIADANHVRVGQVLRLPD